MKKELFSRWMLYSISFLLTLTGIFVTVPAFAYSLPIGIPAPSFGIDQTHTNYSGKTFVNGGFIYKDAGNGPYSHYIDNTSGSCTDIDADIPNTYGTVTKPRCTIPTSIPAGSVIELHGGPYTTINLTNVVGTVSEPIYIRGYDIGHKITLNGVGVIGGTIAVLDSSYIIIENLLLDGNSLDGTWEHRNACGTVTGSSNHISLRHLEVKNYPAPDFCPDKNAACYYSSFFSTDAGPAGATGTVVSNVVFYDINIHNNADKIWPPTYELGRHGVMVASGCEYIWILHNKITRSGDDGVQVYWKATGASGPPSHHIYIGDNEIHDMGENGCDIKQSYDVIISQNKVWNFSATDQVGAGSDGSAIVLNNDDPSDRLWVLYNEIFDSNIGIRSQSHGAVYIIGNVIHDIVRYSGRAIPTSQLQSGTAITTSSSPDLNIINNTIDQVDGGIYVTVVLGAQQNIINNIVTNLNELTGYTLYFNTGLYNAYNQLLYSANGNIALKKTTCIDCITGINPLFVDQSNSDYRLGANSPAFGKGVIASCYPVFFNTYKLPLMYNNFGVVNYFSSGIVTNTPIDIGSCRNSIITSQLQLEAPTFKTINIIP